MDADANHGGHERVMFFCMDHHTVQAVIVEYPVVDPFGCSALVINFFVGIRAAGDIRVQADIPCRTSLDDSSIFGRSTAVLTFGAMLFAKRAPPDEVGALLIIAVRNHA